MTGLEPISADMIDFYVGRPDVVIIDLRSEEEFTSGHIRGAVNIPYDDAEEKIQYSRRKVLLLYCERGVKSVIGGIRAYRGRNFVIA